MSRGRALPALVLLLALVLAACSDTGGAQEEAPASEGGEAAAGGGAGTERLTVAMITHQAPGDTFWDLIRDGATVAAEKNNIELNYVNDPEAGNQANLVQNAIDQGVDGIAVTLAYPDAVGPTVQAAIEAGIPVVAFNSGLDQWRDYGVSMYFGQDELIAGAAAAERLDAEGATNVICVNQEQGQVALEARCQGVTDNFSGTTEQLFVTGTDMPSVRSTIAAKLQEDPTIDRVLTLGAPFALTALQSVDDAGSEAVVVTFDLNDELLGAVQSGDVPWAIDQQPFVQGYEAVDALWLTVTQGGRTVGGGEPVLTGPAFVDSSNIEQLVGE